MAGTVRKKGTIKLYNRTLFPILLIPQTSTFPPTTHTHTQRSILKTFELPKEISLAYLVFLDIYLGKANPFFIKPCMLTSEPTQRKQMIRSIVSSLWKQVQSPAKCTDVLLIMSQQDKAG